jgi:hypothetical protein
MQASFCSSAMERRLAIPAACGSRLTNSIRTQDAVKGLGTAFAKSERVLLRSRTRKKTGLRAVPAREDISMANHPTIPTEPDLTSRTVPVTAVTRRSLLGGAGIAVGAAVLASPTSSPPRQRRSL